MLIKALNSQLAIIPQDNEGAGGQGEETDETTETDNTNEETGQGKGDEQENDAEDTDDNGGEDGQDGDKDEDGKGEGDTGADEEEGDEGDDTGNGGGDEGDEEKEEGKGEGQGEDGDDEEGKGDNEGEDGDNDNPNPDGNPEEGKEEGQDKGENTDNEGDGDNEGKGDEGEGEFADYRDIDPSDFDTKDFDDKATAGGSCEVNKEDENQQQAMADMLETLLDQMQDADEDDIDLKGHNESFGEFFQDLDNDVREGEQIWRPFYPEKDSIRKVRAGNKGVAQKYEKAVRGEVASIAAKLRTKFLLARSPQTIHGVRNGKDLSERRLVNSMVEIRSGRRPTRPDWKKVEKEDCTLAVGLVIDQSGSMGGENCMYATQGAIAISRALDKLGAPIMVCGPRDGHYIRTGYNEEGQRDEEDMRQNGADYYSYRNGPENVGYHRTQSTVNIDLFKDWDERMNKALPRFSQITACGGTPLSDGIQFAMQELSERTERFRVIIVLTDGAANCPAVVKRQIRLAKEAGITVIGVGIGGGCSCVVEQFPANHIQIPNVKQLPKQLLGLLDKIMFPKRAKKARLDGKIGNQV